MISLRKQTDQEIGRSIIEAPLRDESEKNPSEMSEELRRRKKRMETYSENHQIFVSNLGEEPSNREY
jgi:hypothetical protein